MRWGSVQAPPRKTAPSFLPCPTRQVSLVVVQTNMAISPWNSFARIDSPDGRFTAVYEDAMEIAMGAPTRGVLKISEKQTGRCIAELANANGSFIWCSDSAVLAFPQWTPERMQKLVFVRVPQGTTHPMKREYRVLQLDSFEQGVLQGVDSPIHQPSKLTIRLCGKDDQ